MTAKSADHAQGLHHEIEETLEDIEKVSAEKMAVDEDNQRLDAEMEQIVMKHQEIDRDLQYDIRILIWNKRSMEIILPFYYPGTR